MKNRINIPLVLALLIPVAMVLFITASIYLPVLFIKPSQNFLYSTGSNYSSDFYYEISQSHLQKINYPSPNNAYNRSSDQKLLFLHNVTENKSQPISFDEAQKLTLNPNPISSDGYEVTEGSGSYGLFPFSSSYSRGTHYLKNRSYSQKLNILSSGNYYGYAFLGWVE